MEYLRYRAQNVDLSDKHSVNIDIVLGGYSYGALIAMRLPPMEEILKRFSKIQGSGTVEDQIRQTVEATLGLDYLDERNRESSRSLLEMTVDADLPYQRAQAQAQAQAQARECEVSRRRGSKILLVRLSYLFVSPILPPLAWLLGGVGVVGGGECRETGQGVQVQSSTSRYPKLAIVGDGDGFTSVKRVLKWAQERSAEFAEVPGAGHFWVEVGAVERLKSRVAKWINDKDQPASE